MFSIVIPLYNKEHTILGTLNSVFNQTFQNFEVIIVDDGSTDESVQIIERSLTDKRIKVYHQKNQGVSVARNRGASQAMYNYIAFLDGDDEWLPAYLEKMKEAIESFPEAGMFCCAGTIRDGQGIHLRLAKKYRNRTLEVNYFENPQVFSHTSATIVSKPLFDKTQGFPVGMMCNQDFALFYSVALISDVVYCGIPLSVYVGDVAGQTTNASKEKRFELLKHVVDRVNLCYKIWEKTNQSNKLYMIFDKYDHRARLIGYLKDSDYRSINYFLDGLDKKIEPHFAFFEFWLYKNEKLNFIAIMYIYFTKIIWRLHGFTRVGENKMVTNE